VVLGHILCFVRMLHGCQYCVVFGLTTGVGGTGFLWFGS